MFEQVSQALLSILSDLPKVQKQYAYEASNLEGFPALTLTPSANESSYSTTTENRRTYAFVIRLYVARGSSDAAERQCEETMRDLVDSVLDRLDKNYYLEDTTIPSQTGYTFLYMNSAPSVWGYAGRENEMRVATILVQLHFDIDTTLIT